jgi:hypothetical protein
MKRNGRKGKSTKERKEADELTSRTTMIGNAIHTTRVVLVNFDFSCFFVGTGRDKLHRVASRVGRRLKGFAEDWKSWCPHVINARHSVPFQVDPSEGHSGKSFR